MKAGVRTCRTRPFSIAGRASSEPPVKPSRQRAMKISGQAGGTVDTRATGLPIAGFQRSKYARDPVPLGNSSKLRHSGAHHAVCRDRWRNPAQQQARSDLHRGRGPAIHRSISKQNEAPSRTIPLTGPIDGAAHPPLLRAKHARAIVSIHQFARNRRARLDNALLREQGTTLVTRSFQ